MNICAKINSKARPNGLVIGETLFDIVKALEEYKFVPSGEKLIGMKGDYGVYHVVHKEKRTIMNPFDRRPMDYSNFTTWIVQASVALIKAFVSSFKAAISSRYIEI